MVRVALSPLLPEPSPDVTSPSGFSELRQNLRILQHHVLDQPIIACRAESGPLVVFINTGKL